jgi:hypothetical protein
MLLMAWIPAFAGMTKGDLLMQLGQQESHEFPFPQE